MNFFIVISIIMTAITLISILIEPRRFRNGVLILREGFSISHSLSLVLSIAMLLFPGGLVAIIIYANGGMERFGVFCGVMTVVLYFMITFSAFIREYVAVMKMNKVSIILLVIVLFLEIKFI